MKYCKLIVGIAALLAVMSLPLLASPTGTVVPGFNSSTLPGNDDGSTGSVALPFGVDFFGTTYNDVYINNNGNITFAGPYGTYTPYGLGSATLPIIAPFFADVYTEESNSADVTYGAGTYDGHEAFGANWPGVSYYGSWASDENNLLDDFQVLLVDRSDTGSGNFDIYFNYGSIEWETGSASGGVNGQGGSSAVVGFATGTGTYFQWKGSGVPGTFDNRGTAPLVDATNDGVPGQLEFDIRNGQVTNSGTLQEGGTDVPEPASLCLLAAGLFGLGLRRQR